MEYRRGESNNMKIDFFNTYVSTTAKDSVVEVLNSTMLSEGKVTALFEKELQNVFGFQNVITLNSGTSALHLALDICDIHEGDEVIIPAQTFVATALAVMYCKAKPVFADIDASNGNISIASVKAKITAKTKAIICVHWGGYPCDMDELKAICKQHQMTLIEDAAHALGATYKNQMIGNISDITCFSFQAIKHLTTGDGGAITINNQGLYKVALKKKWFGIDRENAAPSELGERQYNLDTLGYKYHLNNYASALGLSNLNGYMQRLEERRKIAQFYKNELAHVSGLKLFSEKDDRQSAYWLFGLHVENRLHFIRHLSAFGIPSSVVHQRIDRNSLLGGINQHLEAQTMFDDSQIHIPIHDAINLEKAEYICNIIKKGW
jgi:perosamine synthetase